MILFNIDKLDVNNRIPLLTMYSTKSIHKNLNPNYPQTYTSIGDPYKSNLGKKDKDNFNLELQ